MRVSIKEYLPLIYVYLLTIFLSIYANFLFNLNFKETVFLFLGIFLIIFSLVKIIRLKDFVEAFSEYDFITQKYKIYGYLFPFFEMFFGVVFLFRIENILLELFCISLFSLNSYSVYLALKKKRKFMCACLGDLIKVPLSKVSLFENFTMLFGIIVLLLI